MATFDFDQLGADVTDAVMGAAKSFYQDGQEMAEEDKAFFLEIAADYKAVTKERIEAHLSGDATKVDEMDGNFRQLGGIVAARVARRQFQIESATNDVIASVMLGVLHGLGALAGGAVRKLLPV